MNRLDYFIVFTSSRLTCRFHVRLSCSPFLRPFFDKSLFLFFLTIVVVVFFRRFLKLRASLLFSLDRFTFRLSCEDGPTTK